MAKRTMWKEGSKEYSLHESGSLAITVKLKSINSALMVIVNTATNPPQYDSGAWWPLRLDGGFSAEPVEFGYTPGEPGSAWPWNCLSEEDEALVDDLVTEVGCMLFDHQRS